MVTKKLKNVFISSLIMIVTVAAGYSQTPPEEKIIPESVKKEVRETKYNEIRIKSFPVAMQGWTYRGYTFFEALDKTKALGLSYLQAYPGQRISKDWPAKAVFDHRLTDQQIEVIKEKTQGFGTPDRCLRSG